MDLDASHNNKTEVLTMHRHADRTCRQVISTRGFDAALVPRNT
jgi:hypothetical protein